MEPRLCCLKGTTQSCVVIRALYSQLFLQTRDSEKIIHEEKKKTFIGPVAEEICQHLHSHMLMSGQVGLYISQCLANPVGRL
uniref:Uncharacterized protein n=1 Tax=Rhipicephalus zambeziensis TaxID=60191 RepID=A0A224YAR5_9ACAR